MIISRTPVRMSFVGGGSDLPSFYREYGGAVLSTAINKYIYVTVNSKFDDAIRLSYSTTEEVQNVDAVAHPLVREVLKKLEIPGGVEITSVADIPSRGTGLGSSSAFGVGLINALSAYRHKHAPAEYLARLCCEIEIDILKEPIGKQDQYSVAYGGLNLIQFHPNDSVSIIPVLCRRETIEQLNRDILCFYTGITRSASAILKKQDEEVSSNADKQKALKQMADLALHLHSELTENRLSSFGEILHDNWKLKKSLCDGISSDDIDGWYEKGRAAGAIGGKLLGAGSGGFLMFYAPQEKHAEIEAALPLRRVDFKFEPEGSRIIFVH